MARKHSAAPYRGWDPLAHVRRAVTDRRRAPASSAPIATDSPNLSIISLGLGLWRDGATQMAGAFTQTYYKVHKGHLKDYRAA